MANSRIARSARGAASYSGNAAGLAVDSDDDRLQLNLDGTIRKIDARALIAATGTKTLVQKNSGSIVLLDTAAGSVVTLPASTGGGAVFEFLVTVTATTNSHIIKVANANDEFRGYVVQDSDTAVAPNIWWAADNDDTITLNRSTTGLAAQGEYFRVIDASPGVFFVQGYSQASGTEATPFTNAVS